MQRVIRSIFVLCSLGFSTVASAQLPPEIMVDKHLIEAEQLHAKEDYARAFNMMEKILALQKEHSLTLPDEFHFKYARVALSADSLKIALESVSKYLSETGKGGEFYKDALGLLIEVEERLKELVVAPEETCVGKPEGSSCWLELNNRPECYVWTDYFFENWSATWTGKCSGNMPDGKGTLSWYSTKEKDGTQTQSKRSESTGHYRRGKMQEQWIIRFTYGTEEGPYVDGKRHGQWIFRDRGGNVRSKGSYVDDKRQGQWIEYYPDGRVMSKGSYVDGNKHGQWIEYYSDGTTGTTTY